MNEQMREAFEKWAVEQPFGTEPDESFPGEYQEHSAQVAWEAWQAASSRCESCESTNHALALAVGQACERDEKLASAESEVARLKALLDRALQAFRADDCFGSTPGCKQCDLVDDILAALTVGETRKGDTSEARSPNDAGRI